MNSHYIVIADHGHLRIFTELSGPKQITPGLKEVHSMDFPQARISYADNDSDMAGRFQNAKGAAPGAIARVGMSIDERLPMRREVERRQIKDVAHAIDAFLASQPLATWDFAADPSAHNAILDQVSPQTRSRLRNSVAKDLVKRPPSEMLRHFNRAA